MSSPIDIRPVDLAIVQSILRSVLPSAASVWVFGSRATWTTKDSSDLDLAIDAGRRLTREEENALHAAFEDSDLPYKVDVVDMHTVSDSFRTIIERDKVALPVDERREGAVDGGGTGAAGVGFRMTCDCWPEIPFSRAVVLNPAVRLRRGGLYPFVDMNAVDASRPNVHTSEERAFAGGGSRFESGDTLFARITPCLENGKIARFKAVGDDDRPAHGSTEFIVMRGRDGVSVTDFVFYLARSPLVRGCAIGQMTGSSGRQRVPTDCFDKLTVAIPPPDEQRAIAAVLGALDDKIEQNRRTAQALERLARAIFRAWFVDFEPVKWKIEMQRKGAKTQGRKERPINESLASLRPGDFALIPSGATAYPGMPQSVFDALPTRFVDSAIGPVPEGWEVKPITQIATFLNGLALQKYPPRNDGTDLAVIKIAQLRKGSTEGADASNDSIDEKYKIRDGDLLFSWSGTLDAAFWFGGPGALNQHLFKVTSADYPQWLAYEWIHQHMPEFRLIAASKATTMGHIKRGHLSQALVAVPPPEFLVPSDEVLSPLFELFAMTQLEYRKLAAMRDYLLPKLLSGQVRVEAEDHLIEGGSL
ncbi:MAG: restriction endonuclease subunit S [Lysobacterales bacterium]